MTSKLRLCIGALAALSVAFSPACGSEADVPIVSDDNPATAPPEGFPLELVVTVDWEGGVIDEPNLRAIEAFRARYPAVRLTHFLNAAYYTKPNANAAAITRATRRALRDDDELGLHVHPWESLVRASGAPVSVAPTFSGAEAPRPRVCSGECGYDVLLSGYGYEALRRVVAFSLDTLEAQGFGRAESFRAGGWDATARVLQAIAAEGLSRDASAVNTALVDGALPQYLLDELRARWPSVGPTSQPFVVDTRAGPILEVPSNGALVDYADVPRLLAVYEACAQEKRAHPLRHVVFSTGFHFDTAVTTLPILSGLLEAIEARRRADLIALRPTTLRELADTERRPR